MLSDKDVIVISKLIPQLCKLLYAVQNTDPENREHVIGDELDALENNITGALANCLDIINMSHIN